MDAAHSLKLPLAGHRARERTPARRRTGAGLLFLPALAADAGVFFAARAGQGVGAAMLSPAALSIITSTFQGPERTKALGVWGAVGGAGAAIGVLAGGLLTEWVDWRAIFFVNLPVGIAVATAIPRIVVRDAGRPRWRGLDG